MAGVLGDRAYLALGLSTGAAMCTADSQWKAVGHPDSGAPTSTPTDCRVSTRRRERTSPCTMRTIWHASQRVSTTDRGRLSVISSRQRSPPSWRALALRHPEVRIALRGARDLTDRDFAQAPHPRLDGAGGAPVQVPLSAGVRQGLRRDSEDVSDPAPDRARQGPAASGQPDHHRDLLSWSGSRASAPSAHASATSWARHRPNTGVPLPALRPSRAASSSCGRGRVSPEVSNPEEAPTTGAR